MNEYNVACEFCEQLFKSKKVLSIHKFKTHVTCIEVHIEKVIRLVHKEDDGFQCPKCKTKLKNPSTFSKHIKDQHNGTSKPISKNKHKRTKDQTGSEEDSGSDEESSVTLKHQKITKPQLNVNTNILYSSSSSFTRLDHDSAVLMASSALSLPKAEQEKKLMLAKVGDWKPISVITKTGKAYSVIASQDVIKELLSDQPSGEWKLPKPPINKETQTFNSPNDLLTHIMYSSPLKHHLSTAKYVELTKDLVKNINRDWTVFPQLRFATSKLFAGAILMDQASALLINAVEPYGRLKATDAHYERRLSVSHDQSSFPTEETEYGWIKFVSVIEDNVRKLKIGTLVSNLLVTSSVRLDSDSIKSKEFVNMGPETPMFAPTTTTKMYINVESLKHARQLIEDESSESVEQSHLFSQLRQVRSKFHCLSTYTLCRSFSNLAMDIAHRPYTIWTMYDYDSPQQADSTAKKSSRFFQLVALSVIKNGINAKFNITEVSSAFGTLKDGQTKEIVADIIDLAKEGNVTIINNYSLDRLLKKLAENMTTSIQKANSMSRKLSTSHLQS